MPILHDGTSPAKSIGLLELYLQVALVGCDTRGIPKLSETEMAHERGGQAGNSSQRKAF